MENYRTSVSDHCYFLDAVATLKCDVTLLLNDHTKARAKMASIVNKVYSDTIIFYLCKHNKI